VTIHHTVGVYPDGSMKHNGVPDDHLAAHIAYNKEFRPGRALFVDGVCVYEGACRPETIAVAAKLITATPPITRDTRQYH
jgi:hypothetical protein